MTTEKELERMGDEDVDTLIQQMMEEAERVPEPGLSVKDILSRGTDDLPAPMIVGALKSAGWTIVYHMETGEPSIVNRNMLPMQLKKKTASGKRAFTVRKNEAPVPWRGELKCMLHEDAPNRVYWDGVGLPVCKKNNLTSPMQVMRHMQHRHKDEWATMEREREDGERERRKLFEEAVIGGATAKIAPLYVSDKPAKQGRPRKVE